MGRPTRIGKSGGSDAPDEVRTPGGEDAGDELIDPETFAKWFGILEDRFSKDMSDVTAEAYRRALSQEMGTDLFVVAAQRIFKHATYFPKPQEIISEARDVRRLAKAREDKVRLECRQEKIKRQMEEQGRRLLEEAEGGVEALKEYLRTHAAVPIDERDRIEGESDEEKQIGPGE